ncbi:putative ABC transport system ATP-binding protein [Cyclonatronum proteinivorum]|uniref:Putative ABC transport system ATP-binding protein n=1 Tax=Cyclonatronum proteinivorum TaxID=1457365 RepID=A0A345UKD4_9BACT|nr:ABC transporter ATP-binding protein [Cyclonatronum proteinivorum]AXJ00936.1 putative ABC transport system ATP-binding protein [Cyclonatronum proteinivorum]
MSAIQLTNVRKSYPDPSTGQRVPILDIPAFTLPTGKHLAVRGTSGSGKTTLLHCISGMTLPDSGSVSVSGTDITRLSESDRDRFRANNIGYIFQSFNLLDGFTALENVQLGMQFADKKKPVSRAKDLLNSVGLSGRLHNRPSQLSVGQQQRVCIARALANDPDIILADEPTGSLDPKTSAEVLSLIKELTAGKTLILVSHETEVLAQFETTIDLSELNEVVSA